MRSNTKIDNLEYLDSPASYKGNDEAVYKVGDIAPEDGSMHALPAGTSGISS